MKTNQCPIDDTVGTPCGLLGRGVNTNPAQNAPPLAWSTIQPSECHINSTIRPSFGHLYTQCMGYDADDFIINGAGRSESKLLENANDGTLD